MSGDPYNGVVVDLVDPYFTQAAKNSAGGFKATSPGANLAIWWMRQHPGRWALVGTDGVGLTRQLLQYYPDIQAVEYRGSRTIDGITRTYARLPHPEGDPLSKALERQPITKAKVELPALGRDEFNWSKAELAEACQIARANLFPTGAP
jgi:hypothetical protein